MGDEKERKLVKLFIPNFKIKYDCDVKGILKNLEVEQIYVRREGDGFNGLFMPVSFSPRASLWWAPVEGRNTSHNQCSA